MCVKSKERKKITEKNIVAFNRNEREGGRKKGREQEKRNKLKNLKKRVEGEQKKWKKKGQDVCHTQSSIKPHTMMGEREREREREKAMPKARRHDWKSESESKKWKKGRKNHPVALVSSYLPARRISFMFWRSFSKKLSLPFPISLPVTFLSFSLYFISILFFFCYFFFCFGRHLKGKRGGILELTSHRALLDFVIKRCQCRFFCAVSFFCLSKERERVRVGTPFGSFLKQCQNCFTTFLLPLLPFFWYHFRFFLHFFSSSLSPSLSFPLHLIDFFRNPQAFRRSKSNFAKMPKKIFVFLVFLLRNRKKGEKESEK